VENAATPPPPGANGENDLRAAVVVVDVDAGIVETTVLL
jgi:hypothetical protein